MLLGLGLILAYDITLWLAIDAFVVMIIAFFGASLQTQAIAAVILGLALLAISRKLGFATLKALGERQTVRANPDELVGRQGIVVISIGGKTKRGLVNLSGEKWVAEAKDGVELAQGVMAEVVSLKGQCLVVKAI